MGVAPELSRPLQVRSLGACRPDQTALEIQVEAEPAECLRLAARLDVPAVSRLQCRFRLSGADQEGRIAVDGLLQATLSLVCVATLETFESVLTEAFSVRFVPEGALPEAVDLGPEDAFDLEADDDVPYRGGTIDLGEAAVEQLALSMDPYPRKPGAELPPGIGSVDVPAAEPRSPPDGAPNPFAALAARRGASN